MADTQENLRSEIRDREEQIGRLQAENEALDEGLERIRKAKKQVAEAKNAYKELRDGTRKSLDLSGEWRGEQYDRCKKRFEYLDSVDRDAVKRIDDVLGTLEQAEEDYEQKMSFNRGQIRFLRNEISGVRPETDNSLGIVHGRSGKG